LCSNVTVTASFTNIPTDNATHSIKVYVASHGGSFGMSTFIKIPNLSVTQSTTVTIVFTIPGVPNGQNIDINASYYGSNLEGPQGAIISNYAMPSLPDWMNYIQTSLVVPSGV